MNKISWMMDILYLETSGEQGPMARPERPRVAKADEVRIFRNRDYVVIEHLDSSVATTHLRIGPGIAELSDRQILDLYNDTIVARDLLAASYRHIAVEIPPGRPQMEYFDRGDQWVPRGDVLRCVVHDGGPDNQAVVEIDDRDFSLEEFGRMLTTYAGWGMRLCFVPDDELEKWPEISIREPDDEEDPWTTSRT